MATKMGAMGNTAFPFSQYAPTNDDQFRSTKGRFRSMYQRQFESPPRNPGPISPATSPNRRLEHSKSFPFKLAGREVVDRALSGSPVRTERATDPTVVVICGPSGVGKSTLISMLLRDFPHRFALSVSHTTRPPRPGEKPGVSYHFVGKEEFMQKREFVEKNEVHGNFYGTSVSSIQKVRSEGKACILDIDVQGAECIKQSDLRRHAVYVFIAPTSMKVLEHRLLERNTETPENFQRRMADAVKEMEAQLRPNFWDFVVVNDNVQRCYSELLDILRVSLPQRRSVGEPPENPDTALRNRRGKVLGQHCLLRGKRAGSKPHLRQVSDGSLIYSLAHPASEGVAWAVDEVSRRIPNALTRTNDEILWIQLRQDPFVYINGRPFSVERGGDGDPQFDRYLKAEIMDECRPYFGQILLHYDDGTYGWEHVHTIETEAEVFQNLNARNIRMARLPISIHFADAQVEQLRSLMHTCRAVVFSSTHGNGRAKYAMAMASLLQQKPRQGISDMPQITAIRKLAEMMPTPVDWVDEVCERVDDGSSFRDLPPMRNVVDRNNEKERKSMRRYIHLCLFAAYLWNQHSAPEGGAFRLDYPNWVVRYSKKLREVWDFADA